VVVLLVVVLVVVLLVVVVSSVGPLGYARALLYASEHDKQRTLGQEPTGRQSSILTSHLVHRFATKTTDPRAHAKQFYGLRDSDTLAGQQRKLANIQ
jgi:hypothetical protein